MQIVINLKYFFLICSSHLVAKIAVFTLENLDMSLKVSTIIISFYKCKSVRGC